MYLVPFDPDFSCSIICDISLFKLCHGFSNGLASYKYFSITVLFYKIIAKQSFIIFLYSYDFAFIIKFLSRILNYVNNCAGSK